MGEGTLYLQDGFPQLWSRTPAKEGLIHCIGSLGRREKGQHCGKLQHFIWQCCHSFAMFDQGFILQFTPSKVTGFWSFLP